MNQAYENGRAKAEAELAGKLGRVMNISYGPTVGTFGRFIVIRAADGGPKWFIHKDRVGMSTGYAFDSEQKATDYAKKLASEDKPAASSTWGERRGLGPDPMRAVRGR